MSESGMNNLMNLKNDLEMQRQTEADVDAGSYIEQEFTQQDQAVIDQIKQQHENRGVVVTDTDADGRTTSQPIEEYAKSLDEKVAIISDAANNSAVIKTLNSGDIGGMTDKLKQDAKAYAHQAYRTLSVQQDDLLTDEQIDAINEKAFLALKSYFKVDKLYSDVLIPKLKKMPFAQLGKIIPEEFMSLYVTEAEIQKNNYQAKERLLTALGYIMLTGPEMDYLNAYIDDENKLALVSQRILRCQMDFAEMLKDETKLSEIVAKTFDIAPNDQSFWAKYIKLPNRLLNEYAQRHVLQTMYKEAYTKLLDEYPVLSDAEYEAATAEQQATSNFNQKARAVIQEEIDEADAKAEVYRSITNLDLMRELYPNLESRYMKDARLSQKFLVKECQTAIERARRCKQNVPYPGFKAGMNREDQIYRSYVAAYSSMIANYNKTIMSVYKKEMDVQEGVAPETNIEVIYLEGYDPMLVAQVFSVVLAIMMGRIMKKCTENTATKYDAIILDSYFQMFSKLGMDIYVMNDVWMILKPLVLYILQNVKFTGKW